ncbi:MULTISPECIES: copper homeostasis membrane protein CopD [Pseudomonas fluorescens group]|uniref:Copper resistance protein D n=1 Tax=Pseudomonas petroselini TaxID=2899822 RepID=A0ABS8R9Q8_9PSED|nr:MULTISPECIES: copper homeostasis membrane protein CopD [Pseudomonas fluorescens group]MCD7042812.1 copper homeostasis membrane protein CopD [Pseudomonas petroselini]MCD7045134.1 copper homeostasis membrane protein CopD [Pseudomonas petroselini]MCD7071565.1 copper homeostasis membrane protein CopD [Pseudomonas petroselini]MCD7081241.1 copper homeostasis membrane protein CopD [Pseudomonas petroselini]MCF5664652.1 copper homeostasis membrane protein CopD [Pseudomonas marginalis]
MATLLVLCRFLHFIVVLLMFGACVFRPWLLGAEPQPALDRQLLRITRALAWLGLISGVAWLILITASMAGSWDAALQPATVQLVLGKTFFGQVWAWHLLLNLLLVMVLIRPWAALRLPLIALLLATLAPVGHGAMLDGLSGQLLILNQVVHLVCVGAWLGGLLVLVLILRQPQHFALEPILRRFSGVGYGLVTGLLMTGLINVRVLTGQLWPTPLFDGFALILLIKVMLVLGMLALALLNRLRLERCDERLGSLKSSVTLEWLLGVSAVAAVSLLGTLPPMVLAG